MDQVPQWLMNAVAAAGMTAYAEDLIDLSNKNGMLEGASTLAAVPPDTLH